MTDRPASRPAAPACIWRCLDHYPDLAALHARQPERYPFLLESVAHGTPQARYDILFAFPGKTLRLDDHAGLSEDGQPRDGNFLSILEQDWRHEARDIPAPLPFPFHGGWFVFLGYELARAIEPSLTALPIGGDVPTALAVRCPAAVIRDHARHQSWLVCEGSHEPLLTALAEDLEQGSGDVLATALPALQAVTEEDPTLYLQRIRRVLDYIRAGDTFQANLSRRWQIRFEAPPALSALYARLRAANPAPFAGLLRLDAQRGILSSSPERLVQVHRGRVSTRPIAGTFPRGAGVAEDQGQMAALIRNPKERAEHVMLVDLERNDLGRICQPGSIRADELLTVETYTHVHHIVSNVSGMLRPGITPVDVIRAVFPGGTITGCPKIRTMQIIAELEGVARGAYTGSMGYINRDGSLDLNILIRSLFVNGTSVELRAGGGIVADSDPQRELQETRAKARGLLNAFGLTGEAA